MPLYHTPSTSPNPAVFHTDLACESTASPVETREERVEIGAHPVLLTRRREADGSRSVTLSIGPITERGAGDLPALAHLLAAELTAMAEGLLGRALTPDCRILVAGLGNPAMTPDAIGPGTLRRMTVTRHLKAYDGELFAALGCCELAALSPGVLGQTGIETVELVRGAAENAAPDVIIAIDALAARSVTRLASTVQLSDAGINPGSGIGNNRRAICRDTVGVPVVALGVPTVVDSSTLVYDALERAGVDKVSRQLSEVLEQGKGFFVSPKESDVIVKKVSALLARAIGRAFSL